MSEPVSIADVFGQFQKSCRVCDKKLKGMEAVFKRPYYMMKCAFAGETDNIATGYVCDECHERFGVKETRHADQHD